MFLRENLLEVIQRYSIALDVNEGVDDHHNYSQSMKSLCNLNKDCLSLDPETDLTDAVLKALYPEQTSSSQETLEQQFLLDFGTHPNRFDHKTHDALVVLYDSIFESTRTSAYGMQAFQRELRVNAELAFHESAD